MDTETNAVQKPSERRKKPVWLWILLGVLIAGIAAAAVWFFCLREKPAEETENAQEETVHEETAQEETAEESPVVLTVGDSRVEACEFNYFYHAIADNFVYNPQNAQMFGIQKDVPLYKQKLNANSNLGFLPYVGLSADCIKDLTPAEDGTYEVTWAELFAENAMHNAAVSYAVCQEAEKAGFRLSNERAAEIDKIMDMVCATAKQSNVSLNSYLEMVYGRGCNEKNYRQFLVISETAQAYPETLEFTDADRTAELEKEPEKFETAAFCFYSVSASDLKAEAGPETDCDAQAKAEAEKMAADFDVNDRRAAIYGDRSRAALSGNSGSVRMNDEAVSWLFDEAREGDVKMFTVPPETEDGENTYIVLKMLSRGNYKTSNFLQITINKDSEYDKPAEGEKTAVEKVEAIKTSLEADPSEENFRKNAAEYMSYVHGDGTAENMSHSAMSGYGFEFYTWAGMESRKPGDWKMFEHDGTTEFFFYLGEGEDQQKLALDAELRREWYTEISEAAVRSAGMDWAAVRENCIPDF